MCYTIGVMILAKYIKSHTALIVLGIFVALIPLLGIPSWARDMLTYIAGLLIAFGTYMLNRKPKEITTIKESLIENPTVGIVDETLNDFSTLNKE